MRCAEFRDYLDDFCRWFLYGDIARQMESHVASCDSCAEKYQEHQELLTLLDKEPEQKIDPSELADFLPGVWAKIETRKKHTFRIKVLSLAPIAATAVFLFWLVFRPAVNTGYVNSDEYLYNYFNPLIAYDYMDTDKDLTYSDSTYYSLLADTFSDEDTQMLEILGDEFSDNPGFFMENSYGLEDLSDENLDILNNKLNELTNTVG